MRRGDFPSTSETLLIRLRDRPGDAEAWRQFVRTYGPRILHWCRRWGLQDADARDVAQAVLIQFARQIHRFHYDPSRRFRGWLRKLTHSAWCDFVERNQDWYRLRVGGDSLACLETIAARDDLLATIEKEYDRQLLQEAMDRVRARVEPRTWQAFWLLNVERLSGKQAADELGMRLGTAFAASAKVRRMIRQEVRHAEPAEEVRP
jgi:RNA polymerase sigma-70 factor (ECF subfamily)